VNCNFAPAFDYDSLLKLRYVEHYSVHRINLPALIPACAICSGVVLDTFLPLSQGNPLLPSNNSI